jgi:predicted protein tyrosine phosphatase
MSINILFICSRNQWRSRTAEDIFKNIDGLNVRSAGTASAARIKVNAKMIDWAELIFVMEKHHKQLIIQSFLCLPRENSLLYWIFLMSINIWILN